MRVCALCGEQQSRGARLQLLVHAPAVQQHVLHGHVVDEVGFPQRRIPLRLPRRTRPTRGLSGRVPSMRSGLGTHIQRIFLRECLYHLHTYIKQVPEAEQ